MRAGVPTAPEVATLPLAPALALCVCTLGGLLLLLLALLLALLLLLLLLLLLALLLPLLPLLPAVSEDLRFFFLWVELLGRSPLAPARTCCGPTAPLAAPAAQKLHSLHLQYLQWLAFLSSLQKAPQAANLKSPGMAEVQLVLARTSATTHASASWMRWRRMTARRAHLLRRTRQRRAPSGRPPALVIPGFLHYLA